MPCASAIVTGSAPNEDPAERGGPTASIFMYVDDVDLCWRLRRAGWRVAYEPAPLDEPARGNVLVCCSRPTGDVVIDL